MLAVGAVRVSGLQSAQCYKVLQGTCNLNLMEPVTVHQVMWVNFCPRPAAPPSCLPASPDSVFYFCLYLRGSEATACWGALVQGKHTGLLSPCNQKTNWNSKSWAGVGGIVITFLEQVAWTLGKLFSFTLKEVLLSWLDLNFTAQIRRYDCVSQEGD